MNATITRDDGKIPRLDGWRGPAFMPVLSFHFLGAPFNYVGAFGVFPLFALPGLSALVTGCISFYCFENPVCKAINRAGDRRRKSAPQFGKSLPNNSSAV